jgi:hypothetical protein
VSFAVLGSGRPQTSTAWAKKFQDLILTEKNLGVVIHTNLWDGQDSGWFGHKAQPYL